MRRSPRAPDAGQTPAPPPLRRTGGRELPAPTDTRRAQPAREASAWTGASPSGSSSRAYVGLAATIINMGGNTFLVNGDGGRPPGAPRKTGGYSARKAARGSGE